MSTYTICLPLLVIGGSTNKKWSIKACHSKSCRQIMSEHGETAILDASEHRPFWLEYDDGVVSVGKGGQRRDSVRWDAAAYHGFVPRKVYLGISTWRNTGGEWIFHQLCP